MLERYTQEELQAFYKVIEEGKNIRKNPLDILTRTLKAYITKIMEVYFKDKQKIQIKQAFGITEFVNFVKLKENAIATVVLQDETQYSYVAYLISSNGLEEKTQ